MGFRRFSFADSPWTPGVHPKEQKKTEGLVTVLEFAQGFEDPNWCVRAHVLYVISGQLEVILESSCERLAGGDACYLEAGTAHRVRNAGSGPVALFVVSDVKLH